MRLRSVVVADFRNVRSVRIEPGERFNLLYGLNGQGKTNLLEAIHLLGSPRSFRTARLPELVRHGEQRAQILGRVESGKKFGTSLVRYCQEATLNQGS